MLAVALSGRVIDDASGDPFEEAQHRDLAAGADLLGPLEPLEQIVGEQAVTELQVLPCFLVGRRCGEDDPALTGHAIDQGFSGRRRPRALWGVQDLGSHPAGEAAVQEAHQPPRWNGREEFRQPVQRDARAGQVHEVGVVRDELMGVGAVAGERQDDDIVRIASGERIEAIIKVPACCGGTAEQFGFAAERVCEQAVQSAGVSLGAAKLRDERG